MANEFIARKGIISLDDAQVTGSLSVTGNISASIFTGSFIGDGSQLSGIEGFPFTGSAGITGSLTVVGPVNATTFTGDGSQLTGIEGFPYTGSAGITGSLIVNGNVEATSFTGSLQGTSTSSSYVQLVDVDGFTAYSSSVNTAIDSVLDATTPLTATVNTTNTPFTLTSQSIVVADSTDGNLTINLPDLNTIVGTPNQKPIIVYKNDYSQNVIYVQPSGSQLINGASQDLIVSIQLAVIYNPTSAGWVTEGTSAQSLAELELFFVPRTETGSFATTGSNQFDGNQIITGSLTVTGGINATITGSATSASYVEYINVANKPALVSGSAQVSFNGITDKPALVSGSSQITYSGISSIPSGIVSGSSQVTYSGLTGVPAGIISSSTQITGYNIFATTGSNQFNGSQAITGSLTVTGQVVAQTLNVQQVTSSIVYSSGSNIFGNSLGNTQQFTGSVSVTGSLAVNGAGTFASSVTATGGLISNGGAIGYGGGELGFNITTNGATSGIYTLATGSPIIYFDHRATSNTGFFVFRNGTGGANTLLTLSAAGAATFASSVTAGTEFISYSGINMDAGGGTIRGGLTINYSTGEFKSFCGISGNAYFQTFHTNGSERMRITSGGNVGIGTDSPTTKLHVIGSALFNNSSFGTASIRLLGVGASTGLDILADSNDGYLWNRDSGNLYFGTSNTERMRISSGGKVQVTNNISDYGFTVSNVNSDGYGLYIQAGGTYPVIDTYNYTGGTALFRVSGAGVIFAQNTSVQSISDIRTKENIQNSIDGLNIINSLRPVRFDFKDGFGNNRKNQLGFIAQEVEEVFPDIVDEWKFKKDDKITYKTLGQAGLIPVLVKAIQEQQSQIESLKAEIQTLKQ